MVTVVGVDEDFESYRQRLLGVAYRMLGSRADAEDAVQETWLRYRRDAPDPADLGGWLITVTARICLDVLRSARVRRERYVGPWLPEPVVTRPDEGAADATDPAERAIREEQVGLALLVVLERLTPEERVAFVLHDVFAVPFAAIARVLATSEPAARQLASRGRRTVQGSVAGRPAPPLGTQRRVLAAFTAAAAGGDLAGLVRVLAPDVVLVGDGGGLAPAIREPLRGVEQTARFLLGLYRRSRADPSGRAELVLVNGELGFVAESEGVRLVMAPLVRDGRVVQIYHVLNPVKLERVPPVDRSRAVWPPLVQRSDRLDEPPSVGS